MTTAERLLNQGREEGREKGREECLIKAALNMFKRGMDLNTVFECVGLPLDQLRLLQRQACQ